MYVYTHQSLTCGYYSTSPSTQAPTQAGVSQWYVESSSFAHVRIYSPVTYLRILLHLAFDPSSNSSWCVAMVCRIKQFCTCTYILTSHLPADTTPPRLRPKLQLKLVCRNGM